MAQGVLDNALRGDLRCFYEDYAQCLDDEQLDHWIDYFVEDCHYRVISRENYAQDLPLGFIYCMNKDMVRDRVTALRETTMFQPRIMRRFVSGVVIKDITENVITSQANFMVTECLSDAEPALSMVGQYLDRVLRIESGFLFMSRDCVVDNARIHTSLIMPV